MKIFVQHATDPISRPQELDSSDWARLLKKDVPDGTEVIDTTKGWIQSLSVNGITFKGDHYAIVENPSGFPIGTIKVVFWNDDPQERTPDEVYAREWTFQPFVLRRGKWIPPQTQVIYISDIMKQSWEGSKILPIINNGVRVPIKNYSEFVEPAAALVRHGVWLGTTLNADYEKEETHSYRESI